VLEHECAHNFIWLPSCSSPCALIKNHGNSLEFYHLSFLHVLSAFVGIGLKIDLEFVVHSMKASW
jgi:hypothetical protein